MSDVDDFLAHYGVLGMKWGRRTSPPGVSRSTNRAARKDANEFAKAKLFYGEGAGTRRKLIKAQVESKSAKSASYKTAFDHHLANQDLGKRASQAKRERTRKDVSASVGKTSRGVYRKLTNGFGSVSLASAVIAGGVVAARQTGADQVVLRAGKTALSTAINSPLAEQVKNQLFKN